MSIQDLGSIGELLAALTTIATLFYLALQIRHSTNATRAATMDTILADVRTFEREVFILNPQNVNLFRRGLSSFESLDANEKVVLNYIFAQLVHLISNMQQHFSSGNISKERLDPRMDFLSSILRTPGGEIWWGETASMYDPEFSRIINEHILKTLGEQTVLERISFMRYEASA